MEAAGAVSVKHIWANGYDQELADVFALQDEITKKDVAAIEPKLLECEAMRTQSCSAKDLGFQRHAPSDGDPCAAHLFQGSRTFFRTLPRAKRKKSVERKIMIY